MNKGFANVVLIGIVVLLVTAGWYFVWGGRSQLVSQVSAVKTYINTNPAFSFDYPASWKEPVTNQESTRVLIDFNNGFIVTTGFYYDQVKGRNSTVLEVVNGYKNSNTVKNLEMENVTIDGHSWFKLTYNGTDTKKNYTEVYIYQDQQIQEEFIGLSADDSVDAKTFNQILSTFKFTKSSPTPVPDTSKGEKVIRKAGNQEGSFLIQKINSNNVEGLWYQAYPVATMNGVPKTLHMGDDIGYACEGVSEKLTSIDFASQTVTFTKITGPRPFGGCPL